MPLLQEIDGQYPFQTHRAAAAFGAHLGTERFNHRFTVGLP
jgi:hypothetical protein